MWVVAPPRYLLSAGAAGATPEKKKTRKKRKTKLPPLPGKLSSKGTKALKKRAAQLQRYCRALLALDAKGTVRCPLVHSFFAPAVAAEGVPTGYGYAVVPLRCTVLASPGPGAAASSSAGSGSNRALFGETAVACVTFDPTQQFFRRSHELRPVEILQNTFFQIERAALHSYGPDPHSC